MDSAGETAFMMTGSAKELPVENTIPRLPCKEYAAALFAESEGRSSNVNPPSSALPKGIMNSDDIVENSIGCVIDSE